MNLKELYEQVKYLYENYHANTRIDKSYFIMSGSSVSGQREEIDEIFYDPKEDRIVIA